MRFDELDAKMRTFEAARDPAAIPEVFLVARIDGRGFTRLTKEVMNYARPYDENFRDQMVATVEHLMTCGFQAIYGYTQSDEISLLFGRDDDTFGRNIRKWTSILAGEASAAFSAGIARPAAFDCRIIELPDTRLVVDYFRWRSEDAHRNALNAWCYWTLRDRGASVESATAETHGMSVAAKNELLYQHRVNFNDLPLWQRRGVGVVWEDYEKQAINVKTGEPVAAHRRRLRALFELPMRDEYSAFIERLMTPVAERGRATDDRG